MPTLRTESECNDRSKLPSDVGAIATDCGRVQIVAIISSHPAFAFRHLLDLIIASAVQIDSKANIAGRIAQRPDLISSTQSGEVNWVLIPNFFNHFSSS